MKNAQKSPVFIPSRSKSSSPNEIIVKSANINGRVVLKNSKKRASKLVSVYTPCSTSSFNDEEKNNDVFSQIDQ
jgi:hypothetical protein